MTDALDRPALAADAAACRRLWASVVLAAFGDYWGATRQSKGDPATIAKIRASALRYFRSRDGREVCMLAGITADPERLADIAIDLTARERTLRGDA